MGCFHAKCCTLYPTSSSSEEEDRAEMAPNGGNNYQELGSARSLGSIAVPSHKLCLEYSSLTQPGYYPDSPGKENQDCFCIVTQLQGNPNLHLFGVFDGHGQFGTECSNFVKDRLIEILSNDPTLSKDPVRAYNSAFSTVNLELHASEIDDSMSGTTAITVLVNGDTICVANVGDSRAVAAVKSGDKVLSEDLSSDQTPFRKDECERVKLCGARVLNIDQVEGLQDQDIQTWGDNENECGDPPRLWVKDGLYPGTAFTRSVGDSTAESIGVISVPEIKTVRLTPNHMFFVVASDGVFEFLSSQAVVDRVMRHTDSREACAAIASESYKLWLEHENRTDDITILIVHIKDLSNSGATKGTNGGHIKPALPEADRDSGNSFVASIVNGYRSLRMNVSKFLCPELNITNDRSHACVVPTNPKSFKT